MAARIIAVAPFDLVVFGATGDLAQRKLIPALFNRDRHGQVPPEARIIGASRRAMTEKQFRDFARTALAQHAKLTDADKALVESFLERLTYVTLDAEDESGWDALAALMATGKGNIPVYYLATGPDLFGPICARLKSHGLAENDARVVIEKPIGKDGDSARALNDAVAMAFPESRVYRIDHYLGKETVQNLMALRFANSMFEPLWNAAHIDNVQITVAETLGLQGRAGYYDTAGAMRDMVQNHLLQLLCLIAMEPPPTLHADSVRDEKLKILKSLDPITVANVNQLTVRGQYRAGVSGGASAPSYLEDLGAPESRTETFVAIKAGIGNWRWAGVPFYLRTGKRLATRLSDIVITFRVIPHSVFDASAGGIEPNRLVIRLQPDEGVKLCIMIKDPGPGGMRLQYIPLDMSFADSFGVENPDAYERLIMDVVRGNQTLFMRRDEVEAAWNWVDPILDAWKGSLDAPKPYAAGTWGPSASVAMIERDGRTWYDDGEG
ncbi:MAG: glucose-6-phosphate dehydrogenase [Proteobacteria bacterium]|nr:glucose-6-phosphate dehydrogenase [Pseudomonadota bacterium]